MPVSDLVNAKLDQVEACGRRIGERIGSETVEQPLVWAVEGPTPVPDGSTADDRFRKGLESGLEPKGYWLLQLDARRLTDATTFEPDLAALLTRLLIDELRTNRDAIDLLEAIARVLEDKPWSHGTRLDFERDVGRLTKGFVSWGKPVLLVWAGERLSEQARGSLPSRLRWIAQTCGIAGVVIRSVQTLSGSDRHDRIPAMPVDKHREFHERLFSETIAKAWGEIFKRLNVTARTELSSNWLRAMSHRIAEVVRPGYIDVAAIARRLTDIASSPEEDQPTVNSTNHPSHRHPDDGSAASSRSYLSADEIAAVVERVIFLLVLEELQPEMMTEVRGDRDSALQLFRLQVNFLNDHSVDFGLSVSVIDSRWHRYRDDPALQQLFRSLMEPSQTASAVETKIADLEKKSLTFKVPLVRPFTSPEQLIQFLDFAWSGDLPYADNVVQKHWDKWLRNLGKWAEEQRMRIRDRYRAYVDAADKRPKDLERLVASSAALRDRLKSLPNSLGPNANATDITNAWKSLHGWSVDADSELEKWAEVAARSPVRPPQLQFERLPPVLDELPIEGLTRPLQLLDAGPRLLHCADVLSPLAALREPEQGGASGDRDSKSHLGELHKDMRTIRDRLLSEVVGGRGLVRFDLGLLLVRYLAALGEFDEAKRRLESLQTDEDPLAQVYVKFASAYVLERSGFRDQARIEWEEVSERARELGARELVLRSTFALVRSRYLSGARDNEDARILWAAHAAVTVLAERSPSVARWSTATPSVFVSYRRKDNEKKEQGTGERTFTEDLSKKVEKQTADVKLASKILWIDQQAADLATQDISPMMLLGLQSASAVILLFSPDYFRSPWCSYELDTTIALAEAGAVKVAWAYIENGEIPKLNERDQSGYRPLYSYRARCEQAVERAATDSSWNKRQMLDRLNRVLWLGQEREPDLSVDSLARFAVSNARM